jgi:tyrosine-protein kinase Etk/Wzc
MTSAFDALLAEARQSYDTVLIDTPPILAVTDAGIVGAKAGATFLVAREEHLHLAELEQAVKRLMHNGVRVTGVIYNDHRPRTRGGAYGGYYYYDYRSKHAAGT